MKVSLLNELKDKIFQNMNKVLSEKGITHLKLTNYKFEFKVSEKFTYNYFIR